MFTDIWVVTAILKNGSVFNDVYSTEKEARKRATRYRVVYKSDLEKATVNRTVVDFALRF